MPFFVGFIDNYDSTNNFTISSGDITGYTPSSGDKIVASACPKGETGTGTSELVLQVPTALIGEDSHLYTDVRGTFEVAPDGNPNGVNYYQIMHIYDYAETYNTPNLVKGFSTVDFNGSPRSGGASDPYVAYVNHYVLGSGMPNYVSIDDLFDAYESIFENTGIGEYDGTGSTTYVPGDAYPDFTNGWSYIRSSGVTSTFTIASSKDLISSSERFFLFSSIAFFVELATPSAMFLEAINSSNFLSSSAFNSASFTIFSISSSLKPPEA